MKATITHKDGYKCAPHGVKVIEYAQGDVVDEPAASWAVSAGRAEWCPVEERKVETKLETKAPRKRRAKKDQEND